MISYDLDLDIKFLDTIPSSPQPPIEHICMLYSDMTDYPPTQEGFPLPKLFSIEIFDLAEKIMEALTIPDYSWDDFCHQSYFPPQTINHVLPLANQFPIETEDNLFFNMILALDAFEQGNMSNISLTMTINIPTKPGITKNIIIGASCSSNEVIAYIKLFKKLRDVFTWSYTKMSGLDPIIVKHYIDNWLDAPPIQ